jgi:hypothetical protein
MLGVSIAEIEMGPIRLSLGEGQYLESSGFEMRDNAMAW